MIAGQCNYLKFRGNPGTHDLKLALSIVDQVRTQQQGMVQLPRYDKSAFHGRGDRYPASQWAVKSGRQLYVMQDG